MPAPGLNAAIAAATSRAVAAGALQPIPTRYEVLEDEGLQFVLRVVDNLQRKLESDAQARAAPQPVNPFLPYDPALFVADLSATHLVLLNKFKVMDGHALIVTRACAEQESPLDESDFAAAAQALQQTGGLAFYNAGLAAGASQRHKHLQLLPWPLAPAAVAAPFDPATWPGAALARRERPYAHAWAPLDSAAFAEPVRLARLYEALLAVLGLGASGGYSGYNLLLTRRWMLAVRRSQAGFDGLSVNALGFAGTLLLKSEDDLQRLRRVRPMTLLRAVSA